MRCLKVRGLTLTLDVVNFIMNQFIRLLSVALIDESVHSRMKELIATKRGRTLYAIDSGEWKKDISNRYGFIVYDDSINQPVGYVVCDGGIKIGVEPAWWIAPEYEGKGYGSRAAILLAEEAIRLGYRKQSTIHFDTSNYEKSKHIAEIFVSRFQKLLSDLGKETK
jgi:hypothetical protein